MEYNLLASLKLHFAELSQQRWQCQPCQMFNYPSGASAEKSSQSQVQQPFTTEATRQQPDEKPSFPKRQECRTSAPAMAAMLPVLSRKHAVHRRLQQQKRSSKAKTRGPASRLRPHHLPPSPLPALGDTGSDIQQPADMHICQETASMNPMNSVVSQSHVQRVASIANRQQALQQSNAAVIRLNSCLYASTEDIKASNAINSTAGCIRAEPKQSWQGRPKPTASICAVINLGLGRVQGQQTPSTFQIASDLSKSGQLRAPNLHAAVAASMRLMHRFVVRRSAIASMGVFTTGYLAAGELLIEYAGEVIRRPLADNRERQYASQGLGLYFFAVDRDHCIDATHQGNIARYINHSCRPNCIAKLVDVKGRKRVFIFATQQIAPMEELTYDYKISGPESAYNSKTQVQAIPCHCNSLLCRGYL